MAYFIRSPKWMRALCKKCLWAVDTSEKKIFLTFDDGPHPIITLFVLDELRKAGAKATFFCIGKNVVAHPEIYEQIIYEGHAVGNHTYDHLNGWKTSDADYMKNVEAAAEVIDSSLFRPPYGKVTPFQVRLLTSPKFNLLPVMWSVLSGDFDVKLSGEKCTQNVLLNTKEGSIVVFHDSEKAYERLKVALPAVLGYFTTKGFTFEALTADALKKVGPG